MSFEEYYALVAEAPHRHARSAAQYLQDVFEHFGTEDIPHPRGNVTRWKLFDAPWEGGKDRLIGQEEVQGRVYRVIRNFVREGRVNKLILLHGPNGSAKSTFVTCLGRALEHYSTLDEGALYRFNWIFPSQKLLEGRHRLRRRGARGEAGTGSFAYLDEDLIDAKIVDELRDHPLLLLPAGSGASSWRTAWRPPRIRKAKEFRVSDVHPARRSRPQEQADLRGAAGSPTRATTCRCCATCRSSASTSRAATARRWCTVEPQLAVDARSRQVTMDRSLRRAAGGAAVGDAARVRRRARRRQPRRHRVRRSAQAAARGLQVPARHGRARPRSASTRPSSISTRCSSGSRTRRTWRRSRRSPSSSRSRGGSSSCACPTCSTISPSSRSTTSS